MEFVRTLNQVQYSEVDQYGVRACDLSLLLSERIATPATFVLTTKAWEAFVKKNNIQYKIDFILKQTDVKNERTLQNAYSTIRKLILAHPVPQEVVNEVAEAYESLGMGAGLDEMMKEDNSPYVLMVSSPTYAAEAEGFEGIIQNVRTMEQVLLGLREIFAMSYTPEAILYRHRLREKNVRLGVIIQSMPKSMASATAYSTDPEHQELVFVHAYKGYTDLRDIVAKDFFHVKKEFLNVVSSQVVEQSKIIVRNEDGHLSPEEYAGRDQTLNDKQVMEVGRLAKKAEKAMATPVKLFFSITQNDEYFVLFANRYAVAQKAQPQPVAQKPVEESPSGFRQDITTGAIVATGAAASSAAALQEQEDEQKDEPEEAPVQEDAGLVVEEHDKYDSEDDDQEDVEEYYEENPEEEKVELEESPQVEEEDKEEVFADDDVLGAASDEELEDETQEFVQEDDLEFEDETENGEEGDNEDYEEEPEDEAEKDAQEDETEVEYEDEPEEDADEQEDSSEDDGEDYEEDDAESDDEQEVEPEEDDQEESDDEVEYEDDADEDYEDEPEEDANEQEDSSEDDGEDYEEDDTEETGDGQEEYVEEHNDNEQEIEPEEDVQEDNNDQEEPKEGVVANEESSDDSLVDDQEEVRDMLNKSFRIIYSELVKRYEKGGEQAPDTITELIQKGLQKQLFHVEGLSELLAIKRKARTDDPISEEEKALVLSVLNDLVE